MKVSELIERLQNLDPEMDVMFEHPAHDRWRTVLASDILRVQENTVRYAEYHRQHVLAEGYDEDEEASDPRKEVVLLG